MTERVPMTQEGKKMLEAELTRLKTVERPRIVKAIEEARAHGDISENAEYAAAKEQQSQNEGRIIDLEDKLGRAEVIPPQAGKPEKIVFGVLVSLIDTENDKEVQYRIVGDFEADIKLNKISISSPLARALIGKRAGDEAVVQTPGGRRAYEITAIAS